jgi:hypothetical protein
LEKARQDLSAGLGLWTRPFPLQCGMPPKEEKPKIPVRASIAVYRDRIADVKAVPGFHPVMRYEAFNLADGKRTVWDIYATLRAETLATGEWYFGKVTPEMVKTLFDNAATAGILTLQDAPKPAETKKSATKKK